MPILSRGVHLGGCNEGFPIVVNLLEQAFAYCLQLLGLLPSSKIALSLVKKAEVETSKRQEDVRPGTGSRKMFAGLYFHHLAGVETKLISTGSIRRSK
jgi:hypothetical protein